MQFESYLGVSHECGRPRWVASRWPRLAWRRLFSVFVLKASTRPSPHGTSRPT